MRLTATWTGKTLRGPDAAACTPTPCGYALIFYNAFAEFLCLSERLDSQPPASGYRLTPADTKHLLHDLTVRMPFTPTPRIQSATAAVAALVADTGRSVPELARLDISALQLDGEACVELADGSYPLGGQPSNPHPVAQCRAVIIAELEGVTRLPVVADSARAAPRRSRAR